MAFILCGVTLAETWPIEIPDVPIPGPPLHIPRLGDAYSWTDVASWAGDVFSLGASNVSGVLDLLTGAANLTVGKVIDIAGVALDMAVTVTASFTNIAIKYVDDVGQSLTDTLNALESYAFENVAALYDDFNALSRYAYDAVAAIGGAIDNIWQAIDWLVTGFAEDLISTIEAWAIDHVYDPLLAEIRKEVGALRGDVGVVADYLQSEIDRITKLDLPGILSKIGALSIAITLLQDFVDNCGQPMCDQFGPGTDLSKWLNALKGLLGLLAGVVLADLTEADLERIAATFATLSSDEVATFFDAFVTSGETLGQAGGTLLGDVGGVALDVLRDVGVPI